MIVDAHNDLLLELAFRAEEEQPFATHWLPKLRSGDVGVQVCPIFVELEDLPELALRRALAQVQAFHRAARECPDDVVVVRSAGDLDSLNDRIGLVLALEGVEPLGYDAWVADIFWELGVRMVSLTWNRRNPFADGLGEASDGGLSGLGRELVGRLSALGVILDLSHASERTFAQVLETAPEATVVASHANCRALVDTPRNLSDDQLRALAAHGGVVGVLAHPFVVAGAHGRTPRRPRRPHRLSRRDRACRTGRGLHRPDRPLGGGHARAARAAAGRNAARRLDRRARGSGGLPIARRGTSSPGLRGRPARRRSRGELAAHPATGAARMKVAVVGGGVIGLACAWYLQEGGAEVVVLERDGAGMAASRGNAGWITPGLSNPLPAPGVTLQALRWMLRSDSPFLLRPRLDSDFAAWLWRFWRSSSRARYLAGMRAMLALNGRTLELYDRLVADGVEFEMHKNGLLFLFLDERAAEEEAAVLEDLRRHGYPGDVRRLSLSEAQDLDPAVGDGVRGAFLATAERFVRPESLTAGLASALREKDVELREGVEVSTIEAGRGDWRLRIPHEEVVADRVLVAAGAWTGRVLAPLGVKIRQEAAKGYSLTAKGEGTRPRHALYLGEAKVGCSPYEAGVRLAGTLELAGMDLKQNPGPPRRRRPCRHPVPAGLATGAAPAGVGRASPAPARRAAADRPGSGARRPLRRYRARDDGRHARSFDRCSPRTARHGRSARARVAAVQDRPVTPEDILVELPELEPEIIGWRRHIHERPELSYEEHETARFVEWKLRRWGLEPERPTPTSVVARLRGGLPGPTIALRADMDALPIQEENTFEFASTHQGVMHACGHDGHTAMLLGVAQLMSRRQRIDAGRGAFRLPACGGEAAGWRGPTRRSRSSWTVSTRSSAPT